MPADCILIEEMNIHVDETMYYPGRAPTAKEPSSYNKDSKTNNHKGHPDPFLLTGS